MSTKPLPPHGSLGRHKTYGCKCDACVDNYRAYQRNRYRRMAYGTWQPYISADPARRHILALQAQGVSLSAIARAAGVYRADLARFVRDQGPGHPQRTRTTPDTASRILAVTADTAAPGYVDSTGTARRVQALAAAGWPAEAVARNAGISATTLGVVAQQGRVLASTARAVADAYARLSGERPEEHGVHPTGSARARNRAAAADWPDPIWWEDYGGIDDPEFDPATVDERTSRIDALGEDWEFLERQGYTREQAAARLGVTRDYLNSVVTRYQHRLARQDMETAA